MTKWEVVSVRPIPGSNGRGFEVEVRGQDHTTPWRRQRMAEINEAMIAIDNVGLVRLLDSARAFAKHSPRNEKEGAPAGTSEAL